MVFGSWRQGRALTLGLERLGMSAIGFPWQKEQCQEDEESLDVSSRQQNEVVVENEDFLWAFRSRVGGKGGVMVRRWTPNRLYRCGRNSMGYWVNVEQWHKVR